VVNPEKRHPNSTRRPGALHRLTSGELAGLASGVHGDGGGLILKVTGAGARWYFRYDKAGRTQYVPLGSLADRSLKKARELAADCRRQIADNLDPRGEWEARAKAQAEAGRAAQAQQQRAAATLQAIAIEYHARNAHRWTSKHSAQWIASLRQHVFPTLGAKPVGEVRAADLVAVLAPLHAQVPETASRIRARLDEVFGDALLRELVDSNPAAAVRKALRGKRARGHHAAMHWREVPPFIAELRTFDRVSITTALALEFLILTAARTAEVLGATWAEVNEKARTWTIPAERMKARQPHVVHLADRALEILAEARPYDGEELLFPSAGKTGRPISNMALLQLLKRMGLWGSEAKRRITVHGFRSAFSTWANETDAARPDVIEAALAHREANAVRRAYNRSQFLDERRRLMGAWGDHCTGRPSRRTRLQLVGAS
jgi:integrase